jgi:hypothetical protein
MNSLKNRNVFLFLLKGERDKFAHSANGRALSSYTSCLWYPSLFSEGQIFEAFFVPQWHRNQVQRDLQLEWIKNFLISRWGKLLGRHDIQHNNTQHNDIQHTGTEHNGTQHNDISITIFITMALSLMTLSKIKNKMWHSAIWRSA